MSKVQRIWHFLAGVAQLSAAILLIRLPENGMRLIALILGLIFVLTGAGDFLRYFSMARYMVGGKWILYQGVIFLDLGIFTGSLASAPRPYIALYLVVLYFFDGISDVMVAREAQKLRSGHFRMKMAAGIVKMVLGLCCLAFMRHANLLVFLFGVSLLWSALARIAMAFRRTAVIYVQQE